DASAGRLRACCGVGHLGFLELTFARVCEHVEWIARSHYPAPGKRKGDARSVDRDPTTPPLLSDVCRRSRATRWVEHKVAGVGRHQDAALHSCGRSLHNKDLRITATLHGCTDVVPGIPDSKRKIILEHPDVCQVVAAGHLKTTCGRESAHPFYR